jgi:hypothetical protein
MSCRGMAGYMTHTGTAETFTFIYIMMAGIQQV